MRESDILRVVFLAIDEHPRVVRIEAELRRQTSLLEIQQTAANGLGVLLEDQQTKLDQIIEVVMDTNHKIDSFSGLEAQVKHLTDRQDAVEDVLRRHVRNRRAHRHIEP